MDKKQHIKLKLMHTELTEIMYLATVLRNNIHKIKSSEELKYDDWPDKLDSFQTLLNFFMGDIGKMIGEIVVMRIDDAIEDLQS